MLPISYLWPLAYLEREAAVVGIICAIFLVLFVVAGIRQLEICARRVIDI